MSTGSAQVSMPSMIQVTAPGSAASISEVLALMGVWRSHGEVIALCQGCFDPLHLGHALHFHEVRERCDRLIVSVGADAHVDRGEGRPLLGDHLRARMVAELRVVDAVVINRAASAVQMIRSLQPDIFAKGVDYQGSADTALLAEQRAISDVGGRFLLTGSTKFSATRIAQAVGVWV